MRVAARVLLGLAIATGATAASALEVTVLPKPGFPQPAGDVEPSGSRLELVSSKYRAPVATWSILWSPPEWGHAASAGYPVSARSTKVDGSSSSMAGTGARVVTSSAASQKLRYAFDLVNFAHAPNGGWCEEVTWAREMDGVLYVENTHLTFASATNGRNAYVSAIDLHKRRLLWRSPALVANARTFVVAGDYIVAGYGFTAEADFLYLDRRTGEVLDRLAVASAPEIIKLRGNRLHVRTYDRQVVARIVR